jgi:hypothetical protein
MKNHSSMWEYQRLLVGKYRSSPVIGFWFGRIGRN